MRLALVLLAFCVACTRPRDPPPPPSLPTAVAPDPRPPTPAPSPDEPAPCFELAQGNGNNTPGERASLAEELAAPVRRAGGQGARAAGDALDVLRVTGLRACDDATLGRALGRDAVVGYAPEVLCAAFGFVAVECVPRAGALRRVAVDELCTCTRRRACTCRW